jgi:hypothetical protein
MVDHVPIRHREALKVSGPRQTRREAFGVRQTSGAFEVEKLTSPQKRAQARRTPKASRNSAQASSVWVPSKRIHMKRKHAVQNGSRALFALLWLMATSAGFSTEVAGPLRCSASGRYLVDRENSPFLVVGDTAWSLIAQLREPDIERYLEDRQKRGFNSIIVNLIEHKFCDNPAKNRAGTAAFLTPGDFSTPNNEYFDFATKVLDLAARRGIVVWLAPAYLGYGGGDEGFFREVKSGGKEKLRTYGEFLGNRFQKSPNLVWILGGDYTPEPADRWTITELARAIHSRDTNHLMTIHAAPETSVASVFGSEEWLTVANVYSYEKALFRPILTEQARTPARPFVLIETTYEGEHDSTPDQIRRQAYWTVLGGGCGQFLGNNPIWHFDGPGLFKVSASWIQALDGPGSRDLAQLRAFFLRLPWWELMPEQAHRIITDGYGEELATCLTANTPDRRLSVTYVPSTGTDARKLTVNGSEFPKPIEGRWCNPTTGSPIPLESSPLANRGLHSVQTPGDNGQKANDWLLVLTAR